MSDQWLIYADAAKALGMSVEGVRQRARREHWRRQIRNEDGKAMVLVPGDAARRPASDATGDQADGQPVTRRQPPVPPSGEIDSLLDRVRELRADLDREREERTKERDRADQLAKELVEAGRRVAAIVDDVKAAERGRAEAEQRAALAEAAQKATQEAADARIEAIRSELQALAERQSTAAREAKEELASWRARPWWKRLAG